MSFFGEVFAAIRRGPWAHGMDQRGHGMAMAWPWQVSFIGELDGAKPP